MKKKTSKEILFERMEKVDPTFKKRINEDMYTDDQITQNFDSWHEPEYDPESEINEPEISTEELISFSEQFIKDMEAQLNRTNPNDPNRKFFEEMITSTRETIENMKKQQGLKEEELDESLMLDGMQLDIPKELMKYYIGTDEDDRKFLFKVPTDDVVKFSKDDRWGKTFTYHPERLGGREYMILYAPKKKDVKMDRAIHPTQAKRELGKWGKYYDPKESRKTPMGGDPEDPSMGGEALVLKIPKSEYPNEKELYDELDDTFDYVSHGFEGNPGGVVSRRSVNINPNKSTSEYWYVEIEKGAILDV